MDGLNEIKSLANKSAYNTNEKRRIKRLCEVNGVAFPTCKCPDKYHDAVMMLYHKLTHSNVVVFGKSQRAVYKGATAVDVMRWGRIDGNTSQMRARQIYEQDYRLFVQLFKVISQ